MPAVFDNGMWACGRGAIAWGRGKTVLGRLEKAGPACILDQQHVVCQAFHKGRWQVVAIDVAGPMTPKVRVWMKIPAIRYSW